MFITHPPHLQGMRITQTPVASDRLFFLCVSAWSSPSSLLLCSVAETFQGPVAISLLAQGRWAPSGGQYPDLELEKHLWAFETSSLEALAFEKPDKQTWAQEGTHSPFFPLPFKLIKVKFSELYCLTSAFKWASLFYLLCLSQVQAAWRFSGQQRPLSGSVDISGDVKGPQSPLPWVGLIKSC